MKRRWLVEYAQYVALGVIFFEHLVKRVPWTESVIRSMTPRYAPYVIGAIYDSATLATLLILALLAVPKARRLVRWLGELGAQIVRNSDIREGKLGRARIRSIVLIAIRSPEARALVGEVLAAHDIEVARHPRSPSWVLWCRLLTLGSLAWHLGVFSSWGLVLRVVDRAWNEIRQLRRP